MTFLQKNATNGPTNSQNSLNRIPRPAQRPPNLVPYQSSSQGRMIQAPLDFHNYPITYESPSNKNPISEFTSPSQAYPYKKSKIMSIKAHYNQVPGNEAENYESFFYRRNSPKFKKFAGNFLVL